MKKLVDISWGLKATQRANVRLAAWYNARRKPYNRPIASIIKSNTFEQKGLFEAFFMSYNYGIFVTHNGYDIFCINPELLDEQTLNANWLWQDADNVDFHWKRHWREIPPQPWGLTAELRLEYFTIKVIIEVMTLINADKKL